MYQTLMHIAPVCRSSMRSFNSTATAFEYLDIYRDIHYFILYVAGSPQKIRDQYFCCSILTKQLQQCNCNCEINDIACCQ